jgi:hypothetical protein
LRYSLKSAAATAAISLLAKVRISGGQAASMLVFEFEYSFLPADEDA